MTVFAVRRWPIWALVAVLVVGAVVTGAWWKPWQSVKLPQSACWGALTKGDYKMLAGDDGTALLSTLGSIDGPYPGSYPTQQCDLSWNTSHHPILTVSITPTTQNKAPKQIQLLDGGAAEPVDFGADAAGWIGTGSASVVDLYLTCDYRQAASLDIFVEPYVEITVAAGAGGITSASPVEVRQAIAAISLKLAKAVVQRIPCSNAVRLADHVPSVPLG
ncbi:hypothetical protein P3T36_002578 [Kitasatospora sp. MAP12-15]|uniref:hypothetical protein n=1 Tax=unclassified Kitasatospora TaxID=2633591 RepID=UPI002475006A|nr:hypothetical protein [Kitasatospora sp. MAP12-44]MDH6112860.1 hypothetical protein [Kitasatospora sp. MAP12-44]